MNFKKFFKKVVSFSSALALIISVSSVPGYKVSAAPSDEEVLKAYRTFLEKYDFSGAEPHRFWIGDFTSDDDGIKELVFEVSHDTVEQNIDLKGFTYRNGEVVKIYDSKDENDIGLRFFRNVFVEIPGETGVFMSAVVSPGMGDISVYKIQLKDGKMESTEVDPFNINDNRENNYIQIGGILKEENGHLTEKTEWGPLDGTDRNSEKSEGLDSDNKNSGSSADKTEKSKDETGKKKTQQIILKFPPKEVILSQRMKTEILYFRRNSHLSLTESTEKISGMQMKFPHSICRNTA